MKETFAEVAHDSRTDVNDISKNQLILNPVINGVVEIPKQNIAVVWHEAIAGRKYDVITSAYFRFLLACLDKQHITIWVANCGAQKEN